MPTSCPLIQKSSQMNVKIRNSASNVTSFFSVFKINIGARLDFKKIEIHGAD